MYSHDMHSKATLGMLPRRTQSYEWKLHKVLPYKARKAIEPCIHIIAWRNLCCLCVNVVLAFASKLLSLLLCVCVHSSIRHVKLCCCFSVRVLSPLLRCFCALVFVCSMCFVYRLCSCVCVVFGLLAVLPNLLLMF